MTDRKLLHPDVLRKLLRYEPETGKLFWLARDREYFETTLAHAVWNKKYPGKEAFTCVSKLGYIYGCFFGKSYLAHRVIWAMQTGAWPKEQIDHIDRDKSNNKIENLRESSISQNGANRTSKPNSSSGYLGVYWSKQEKKWIASIRKGGKRFHLGRFDCEEDAARAYDTMAIIKHGQFANLNFPCAKDLVAA